MRSRDKIIILFLSVAAMFAGCINNDIPYPRIVLSITEFQVSGQTGPAVIDSKSRTVTVDLADTVNKAHVQVLKFEVSDEAEVSPEMTRFIDLTNDRQYTLSKYQDYTWIVRATQTIERYVTVDNQVGEAAFNEAEKLVLVYVSKAQPLNNINITAMKLGPQGSDITPDFTTVKDFTKSVLFTSTYKGRSETWKVTMVTSSADVVTGNSNAWAKKANLTGSYVTGGAAPGFEYRQAGSTDWNLFSAVDISGTTFSGWVSGLTPNTRYEYRAVSGSDAGEISSFVTEESLQFPNMGFDNWYTEDGVISPNIDLSAKNFIWDTGNEGGKIVSKFPTQEEKTFVVKGSAAKLKSESALNILAAGNIFTGEYAHTFMFPPGAKIYFGRPYTSRPARLKGYYNYTPGLVDKFTKFPEFKNKPDSCHIYVVLSDLNEPLYCNTQDDIFVDAYKDNWVAYGEFKTNGQSPANQYETFSVELKYFSLTRKPKYAVIVATSSKYGDYFVGSTDSLLYLDELEFEFD